MNFEEKIEMVRRTSAGVPKKIEINLAVQATDQRFDIAGNVFYVFSSSLESDYVGIKVNETREPMINYSVHCGLITPFHRLYITTPAGQTGTMTIIYGTEAPDLMEILDHRSTTVAEMDEIIRQLRGDTDEDSWNTYDDIGASAVLTIGVNPQRCGFWLDAPASNTHPIYLGFDASVSDTNFFKELQPGTGWGCDNYRGNIYVYSTGVNQTIAWGEW